jgi:hypothetical protein
MTVEISAVTPHDFARFKELMDQSVRKSLAASFMSTEWRGTSLHATAPGVTAIGEFHNGQVRLRIMLSFPATMMQGRIVEDITRTMRDAGCHSLQSH